MVFICCIITEHGNASKNSRKAARLFDSSASKRVYDRFNRRSAYNRITRRCKMRIAKRVNRDRCAHP